MRVLVADDDPGSRMVVQAVIEGLGHECILAEDGQRAWSEFSAWRPEVFITDWLMPGIDGLELCRRVRADDRPGYTYVILATSLGERQDIRRGMEAGADDYLVKPVEPFDLETRLVVARRVTALHAELGESQARLEGMNTELARLACTDPLTQLRNRLSLARDLVVLHARAVRYGSRYCLAVIDVDHFKAYNDTYGHQAGDEALRMVADTVVATLREADSVYRFGGEEFLAVLPEQDLGPGGVAGERVRLAVEERRLPHIAGGAEGVITVSAGVAAWRPGDQASPEDVLKAADSAMYQAKSAGRNRVVRAPE
ncbi:MAG: GGDEF domain-containing response regulator [Acidimicrobiia bacterium]